MCNSIILENKLFDSQWDNKNHTLFENLIPTDNNNNNYYYNNNGNNNNHLIENDDNNNNNLKNDKDSENGSFYNSNIPNEIQLNKYSRFGFKPSQSNSNKYENEIEKNNLLSFTINSFLFLVIYILLSNYQLFSNYFIIFLSLNFIITLITIKLNFKFQNFKNIKNIIYKIKNNITFKLNI
ncbi:hypothetical protein ACTA71_007635 [Dictyostelium dimigraforme]